MRRKSGVLLPIELSILEAAIELRRHGTNEFHGFKIAAEISESEGSRLLTAYGTLYKALSRMEKAGLLESQWEGPADRRSRATTAKKVVYDDCCWRNSPGEVRRRRGRRQSVAQ